MIHRQIHPEHWRAILARQSPLGDGLLYLWTAAFLPEAFDAPLIAGVRALQNAAPAPALEYTLALLNAAGAGLKAPPFHAHLAFVVHRIGFTAGMLEALSQRPAATAILLFAMAQGDAADKLPWLRRWLSAVPAKSARGLILRGLIGGAPVSNPFQALHLQTLAQAWLLASECSPPAPAAAPGQAISSEVIWKRLNAHPIAKPWIRLRLSPGQAAPVSGPVTIQ